MFETATRTWKIKTENEARGDSSTLYTRHGDVFVIGCAVLSSLLFVGSLLPVNAKKNTNPGAR